MLTIWGRANSVNVQKVLWCCDELGLPFERIDAGLQYGRNDEAEYLSMNPTGRIDHSRWRLRALGVEFNHPLSRHAVRAGCRTVLGGSEAACFRRSLA